MRSFLATVLSVIAAGVMLIAYGLLSPRAIATDVYPAARPMFASEPTGDIEYLTPRRPLAYAVSDVRTAPSYDELRRENADLRRATFYSSAKAPVQRRRSVPARGVSSPGRDWTKTAMLIGGTTAAGAGLGAIFGGKRGALIGAAIGGGAGTLLEVKRR